MQELFNTPLQSGFLVFTLGILFILSVYHTLLYFQHRDKLYLLYGAYTFFIIISQMVRVEDGFIADLMYRIGKVKHFTALYTEIYYIIYFFFAFKFLNVMAEFPKWSNYCFKIIHIIIIFCVVKFVAYLFTGNYEIVEKGYYFFVALMVVLSIITYILFFKLKNSLRYYIIVGSLILSITSYISLYFYIRLLANDYSPEPSLSILYIGFILENILFSLGIGQKQKIILDEKNETQKKLITQLKENEKLRYKDEQRLQLDLAKLSEQVKADKIEKLKAKYDKELADLKIASLRSQMNPHFIFNSLNSIKRYIIDNEKENAVYYLNKFSKLIRKILATANEKEITLADEIETLELYINIENIRFNNEIDYYITTDKTLNLETIKIPSLILQPFIENAIWHGLSLKKENKKLEIILSKDKESHIKIDILDNGIGRKRSAEIKQKKIHKKDSIGIKLTEERLSKFSEDFENVYSLNFTDLLDEQDKPSGTKVTLRIPIK